MIYTSTRALTGTGDICNIKFALIDLFLRLLTLPIVQMIVINLQVFWLVLERVMRYCA